MKGKSSSSNLQEIPADIGIWVALGKFLGEFVYLAVEICHRWTLLSATPSFQVRKNFENRQKHQRRRSAWVGEADFGKISS